MSNSQKLKASAASVAFPLHGSRFIVLKVGEMPLIRRLLAYLALLFYIVSVFVDGKNVDLNFFKVRKINRNVILNILVIRQICRRKKNSNLLKISNAWSSRKCCKNQTCAVSMSNALQITNIHLMQQQDSFQIFSMNCNF